MAPLRQMQTASRQRRRRMLSQRERDIITMRFACGQKELTQKEVADRLGISQSYISRLKNASSSSAA
ncbi:MAG: sigma factor-like helix-turn-helix DNA-binding protein [Oscillospiraceae bacterium]